MEDNPWVPKAHTDEIDRERVTVFDHNAFTVSKKDTDSESFLTLEDVLNTDQNYDNLI